MSRTRQYLLVAVVAVAAGIAGYLTSRSLQPAASAGVQAVSPESVDALFALTLPDSEGQPQQLAQWRGKVIVANFWATWCPPCRKEIPDFAEASRNMAADPVQFVGISIDSVDRVRTFDDEFDVPYPLLIAGPDVLKLAAGFGNTAQALPFTVIIDRDGRVRHIKLGTLNRSELEGKIRAMLAS